MSGRLGAAAVGGARASGLPAAARERAPGRGAGDAAAAGGSGRVRDGAGIRPSLGLGPGELAVDRGERSGAPMTGVELGIAAR